MAKPLERRRSERFEVNAEFAELEPGTIAYVSNLSEFGVFINTADRLPLGAAVDLRFTILLDDPVVITGTGRVVHHKDEPLGMGVVFSNLDAAMQLRVIDAIAWHRVRLASRRAPRFRTRELTRDEVAQLEAEEAQSSGSYTSLSASAVMADESVAGAARSGLGDVPPPPAHRAAPPPPTAAPKKPPPPPPPPKDDEYEDF